MEVPQLIFIIAAVTLVLGMFVCGLLRGQARRSDLLKRHGNLLNQYSQLTDGLAQLEEKKQDLGEKIQLWFMIEPCSRCHEFKMTLIEISPSVRSIHYQCLHCEKKMRAPAGSPNASKISELFADLEALVRKHNDLRSQFLQDKNRFLQDKKQYDADFFGHELVAELESELIGMGQIPGATVLLIFFESPAAPLPYEQTSRTPIPEAVRSEVWRRDSGQCVKCGSKQNLQFDHIIPISLGGATTVANLQLLCQPCNGSKGKKV